MKFIYASRTMLLSALVALAGCASTQPPSTKRAVTSIVFSPDQTLMAYGNADEIQVVDFESGKPVSTLRAAPAETKDADPQLFRHGVGDNMVFLDGTRLVSTGMGGLVSVWDAQSGARLAVIDPLDGGEFAATLDYSAPVNRLVIGTSEGQVLSTTIEGDKPAGLDRLTKLPGYVWDLQLSRDGRYLASAALTPPDKTAGEQANAKAGRTGGLKIQEKADDSTYSGISDSAPPSNVIIWDLEKRERVGELKGATGVYRMALVPGEQSLLTAGNEVQLWAFLTQEQYETVDDPSMALQTIGVGTAAVVSVAALAVGVFTPFMFGENLLLSGFPIIPSGPFIRHACARTAAVSPDGQTIVSTTWGPSHNVMAAVDRDENRVFKKWGAEGYVCDLEFRADGKQLVAATSNGVFIFDTATWKKTKLKAFYKAKGD